MWLYTVVFITKWLIELFKYDFKNISGVYENITLINIIDYFENFHFLEI